MVEISSWAQLFAYIVLVFGVLILLGLMFGHHLRDARLDQGPHKAWDDLTSKQRREGVLFRIATLMVGAALIGAVLALRG